MRKLAGGIAFNLFAWAIVFVTAFPLVWMVITSVKPQFELFRIPPTFWPEQITFEHYARLLWDTPFLLYMRNSLLLSSATTLLVVTAFCAPLVIAGFWLRTAAEPLTRLVDAPGDAAPRLMGVMREFQRVFALQRTSFAVALVVAVAGVLIQATR
jgi:ABC-type glycerol-3-phosphate transport system permease component